MKLRPHNSSGLYQKSSFLVSCLLAPYKVKGWDAFGAARVCPLFNVDPITLLVFAVGIFVFYSKGW